MKNQKVKELLMGVKMGLKARISTYLNQLQNQKSMST